MHNIDVALEAVCIGDVAPLDPEGQPSAIGKQPVDKPVAVTCLGLAGDHQGDPRVHGGPAKALHYFSAEGYERLAAALPRVDIQPGVLGENLRGRGMTEADVHIGDTFRVGTALAQVSMPRSPCWKIDNVLDHRGANQVLSGLRCQGWYLRVLEQGAVGPGDHMTLVERINPEASLDELLAADGELRPDPSYLLKLADMKGLDAQLAKRLRGRARWLELHA